MAQAPLSSAPYLASPRSRFLLQFWNDLRTETKLPQLDRWLAQKFRADRRLGKKDRLWYSDALFAAMRFGLWAYQREAEWLQDTEASASIAANAQQWAILRSLSGERLFLWISLMEFPEHPWCLMQAEGPWLRSRLETVEAQAESRLRAGLSELWQDSLERRITESHWSSKETETFLHLQNRRARVWLRSEEREISSYVQSLSDTDAETVLRKEGAIGLPADSRVPEILKHAELQDWASQCIGAALPLNQARWVWDACAGGGGKSLQLASRMAGSKAKIIASDIRAHKLRDLEERALRNSYSQIQTLWWDGESFPQFPSGVLQQGGFDAVLVDAPCSSTGTWRRSPDARLRFELGELRELLHLQARLLKRASEKVRVGGWLCYATCSWLVDENEEQVRSFLQDSPDFELQSQELCGAPYEDADTMYWALLKRNEKRL